MGIPGIDAVDDIGVFTFGMYFFIELCPQDVVQEHIKALTSNMDAADNQDEIVDAEAKDITTKK
jgi:hypothetical protein